MAYELIRVSELAELSTPADVNVLPIQAGDTLKKITFANLKGAAVGDMEGSLAAAYDSTATYAVGDYCVYEGRLYRCTTAITTAEAWTSGHWTSVVLTDDMASAIAAEALTRSTNDNALAADIAEALGDLAAVYSTSATYAVGDYCIYQGQLYRCATAITTAEAWTSGHWSAVALGNDTRDLRSAFNPLFNDDLIPVFKFDTLGSGAPYLPLPKYFSTEKKYAICFNPSETATFTKVGLSTGTAASTIVVMLGENVEMTTNVPCWFNNVEWADTAKYIYFAGHNFNGTIVIYEQDNFVKKDVENNVSVGNADFVEKDNPDLLANAVPVGNVFYSNSNGTASYLNGFYSYEVSIGEGIAKVYPYNEFGSTGDRYIRSICFYDGADAFISGVSGSAANVTNGVSVPSNARKIRASLHYAAVDGRSVIAPHFLSTRRGNQKIERLAPQISATDNNIRIPCINFQFDDGSAKDADIVTIFNTAKLKCGFALISNISATDALRYKGYQDNGYEIICHADSGTGMNDTSVSLATNEARLKNSKEILETYGFVINGFVTPNSTMADMFKPILRKYYQWAETVYLGEYTGTETPYMTPVNGAYNGFRVSLQTTTLANQKAAVDECIANYGCLTFYGHAASLDTTDYLTTENLTELLTYINQKITSGECICDTPSNCIRDYFSVRNDDVSDGWVAVSATEANLDSNFNVNMWSMHYNEKLKLLHFMIRVNPTEAVSGQINALFTFPKKVEGNDLIMSETGRNCIVYSNGLLIQGSGTWAAGTNYRFSGMLKLK